MKRLRKFLSQYDWTAIVGSALVLLFVILVFVLPYRASAGNANHPQLEQSVADQSAKQWCESSKSIWERTTCDPVALYTLWLSAFTFVLAISTIGLWWTTQRMFAHTQADAERQAKDMQATIKLARTEFVSTHRPRIILREAFVGTFLPNDAITVNYRLSNTGETRAIIARSVLDLEAETPGSPRPFFNQNIEVMNQVGPHILFPGETILLTFTSPHLKWNPLVHGENASPFGPKVLIHFIGELAYVDDMELVRRTAFHRVLVPEKQRFYKIEDEPDLDYAD